ncbi:MAG: glycosyltransferase family 39 protein [Burkholderiales bacterium]|nr:glycosyltransferase family 39 protein [Bacteroidia bacterium]
MEIYKKNRILFLIFASAFILYGNSIKNKYALDDGYVTVTNPEHPNNPKIEKGLKGIPEIFTSHYIESKQQSFEYRPLVLVTFAIEYQFFGSNPHVSHFLNVLIYAITCIILYLILCRLFDKFHLIFPLTTTLLFLVHPIHTEVVANIKCRDELLSFLFGMLSLLFILKNIESKKITYIFLSIMFFFMSLLCKQTAMLFIIFIPITLYFFSSIKTKQLLFFCAILLFAVICSDVLKNIMLNSSTSLREFAFFENPLFYDDSFLSRFSLALYTIGYYIKLLVFPYPLCCYYGYNTIPIDNWESPFIYISGIFYLLIIIYAIKKIPIKSILSYSILIYLLGILPFANIKTPLSGIVGERFIYFASFGFCIASTYLLLSFFKINLKVNSNTDNFQSKIRDLNFFPKFFISVILIIYSTLTISRSNKWKDEITLFRNDIKHFKNSCNLHYLIGNNLYPKIFTTPSGALRDSIIRETTFHYKQAVLLMIEGVKKYPADFTTLNNIGTIYINIFNDAATAQPFFKKSIIINPDDDVAQYNYAFCYEKRNLPDSAIFYYEKMILANKTYPLVYIQLRELYIKKHQYLQAIICDKEAIKQNPIQAKLYINLGNTYMLNKDTLKGIEQFEKAVNIEQGNVNLRAQIIAFLKSAGYIERAKKLEKN